MYLFLYISLSLSAYICIYRDIGGGLFDAAHRAAAELALLRRPEEVYM